MAPSRPKFVVYYRVSTQRQGRSGLGLDAQQSAAEDYINRAGGVALATYREVESGKVDDRPQLQAALLRCRQSRATLLIAKLDRLGRNAAFLFALRDSGQKFLALDIPDANALTLGVMISMAQHEREIISARTKAALAARKARGLRLGNPRDMRAYSAAASEMGQFANRKKAIQRAKEVAPKINEARQAGHTSLQAIANYLNEQEIQTPRGKQWTRTAVANAMTFSQDFDADQRTR